MGKATIYEHLGDGRYRVLYQRNNGYARARVLKLEAQKQALDDQLFSGENSLTNGQTAAQTHYDLATNDFENALDNWAACASQFPPCPDQAALMQAVMTAGQARAEAGLALTTIKNVIAENRAQYFSVTQEIAYLANTAKTSADGEVMEIWCVDYAPDNIIPVDTVVGTVETFGARGDQRGGWLPRSYINIRTSADAVYSAARDQCATPFSSQGLGTLMYNYLQWLYVMANNPLHAVGTVQSKFSPDQDWLDVELFGNTPTGIQPSNYPFDGDNSVLLLNVPVSYLSCGARAFEAGDRCVVRFGGLNRADPVVIGFTANPFPCALSAILVRALFAGLPATETRVLAANTCTTAFNAYAVPDTTSIGWLDWLDDTGEAALWIQVGGSLGKYRYGQFVTRNPGKRTIYRRHQHSITVAADIYGMTRYAGQVYYVTRIGTTFQLRDTAENVLASHASAGFIMDGWFKFNASGNIGVTMIDTKNYLQISLATNEEGAVSAGISLQDGPPGLTLNYSTTAYVWPPNPGFCQTWFRNLYTGTSRAWACDFVGNTLQFLYIEGYLEILSLPASTLGCFDLDFPVCTWRTEGHDITRYRIGPSSPDFDPVSNVGVLRAQKTSSGGSNGYDYVPAMDGSGNLTLTDIDIRRHAAAFCGTAISVTGANTGTQSTNVVFVFGDAERRIENIADDLVNIEFAYAPSWPEGGILHGGNELPPAECPPANYSETSIPAAVIGFIPFTGTARAELFTLTNSDALFFARGGSGPYTYSHARFCDGAFSDITAQFQTIPDAWGYQS